ISVTDDRPGTTRDRVQAPCVWRGVEFIIVDTGGIEPLEPLRSRQALAEASSDFVREIREQAEIAIHEADVLIFMVDAQAGLSAADEAVADVLRKLIGQRQKEGKAIPPVLVAANKSEADSARQASVEFYRLGFGQVYPISALHGTGTGDLMDAVVAALPAHAPEPVDETVKIALIGRPNVGKSSLYNRLIGSERVIVSDVPGTTRDAIDTVIEFTEQIEVDADQQSASKVEQRTFRITLIDTAGIRKRGAIEPGVEKYSVLRAFRAIERADVTLLLLDAGEGITAQDEHIGGYIVDASKGVVLVVNKWDLIEGREHVERTAKPAPGMGLLTEKMKLFLRAAQERFNFMAYAPPLFVSAKTGFRCDQILPTALRVYESRSMRISTSDVNRILREAAEKHAPPTHAGKRLKIYYGAQVGVNPPTFVFHVNDTELAHFTYRRFLENRIRDEFGFLGTPIRLVFRGRKADE
ncbi:MAG: ribosome biogenesis GTPase Der, partial [Anaerolineae bacterium]|nr:ribosome biogenesis GTPase Der [Thermoflexales bacterium]MDW8408093.1 ribosome biogenesis GTPase Der [Anaerolineae bacterium]